MSPILRILVWSLLMAGLGAVLAAILFGRFNEYGVLYIALGCVGAIVGAVAGAAKEIADAMRSSQRIQ